MAGVSAISNRLDFLPLESDEYKTLHAEVDAKKAEYEAAHIKTETAHNEWRAEQQRCFCVYTFKPLHLEVLVNRLKGISESIIADIKRWAEEFLNICQDITFAPRKVSYLALSQLD